MSQEREGLLHGHLVYDVHLVSFSSLMITLRLLPKAPKNLPMQLQDLLKKHKNEEWTIAISDEIGQPTLHEKAQSIREEKKKLILETPLVKQVMETFPGTILLENTDR